MPRDNTRDHRDRSHRGDDRRRNDDDDDDDYHRGGDHDDADDERRRRRRAGDDGTDNRQRRQHDENDENDDNDRHHQRRRDDWRRDERRTNDNDDRRRDDHRDDDRPREQAHHNRDVRRREKPSSFATGVDSVSAVSRQPQRQQQHHHHQQPQQLPYGVFPYPSRAESQKADDFLASFDYKSSVNAEKQQQSRPGEEQAADNLMKLQDGGEAEERISEADEAARRMLQHVVRDQLRDVRCRHVSPLELVRQSDHVSFQAIAEDLMRAAASFTTADATAVASDSANISDDDNSDSTAPSAVKLSSKYDVAGVMQTHLNNSLLGRAADALRARLAQLRNQRIVQMLEEQQQRKMVQKQQQLQQHKLKPLLNFAAAASSNAAVTSTAVVPVDSQQAAQ